MFDFDDEALDQMEGEPDYSTKEPALIGFYSGGFLHKEGRPLLDPLLEAAAKKGIGEALVCGFPDHYGITEEGYPPWVEYVDRLVQEIDDAFGSDTPVLIFGHSRGGEAALSLATRLGKRVRKLYIASCGGFDMGKPTPWEDPLGKGFKEGGVKRLLQWFASLQPDNLLLKSTSELAPEKIPDALAQSKFLTDKVNLMRVQYMDACFPEMTGDNPAIKAIDVPIMAFHPIEDLSCPYDACEMWKHATTASLEIHSVKAGHMSILQKGCECLEIATSDMAKFLPAFEATM